MPIATRRVLPENHAEVRRQLETIERRVRSDSLSNGDRGPAVQALQERLQSFGLQPGPADGAFGPLTEAAVRRFQRGAGIVVDGVAGPQTLRALRQHTSFVEDKFETPAKKGQRGADVRGAERLLKDLGMAPGAVDGVFDQQTADAVARFREGDPALPEGARIDAATFARMRERASEPLERGDKTRGVGVVERNLERLGIDAGNVDNNFDRATARGVKRFQAQRGLAQTGVADPTTRRALQRAVDRLPPPLAQQLEEFSRKAPAHNYQRISAGNGEIMNKRTGQMLDRAEFIMRNKFGHDGFNFSVVQGSYSNDVAASANTHAGGGALDIHTRTLPRGTVDDAVKALRMAGFAAWSRGRGHDRFDPHIHAIAIGDREASSDAKAQVQEYFNGGDGLIGSAADPDRGLGRDGLIPQWAKRFNR